MYNTVKKDLQERIPSIIFMITLISYEKDSNTRKGSELVFVCNKDVGALFRYE